jgi:Family of unknown function (DUF5947)
VSTPEVLKKFLRPERERRPGEECDLCGAQIAHEHSHVVNLEGRNLLCTCRACYLLFTHDGAAGGKYRAVPDRYLFDADFRLTPAQWDTIQIPVGMAFIFFNSALDRYAAFYPSPAGATESLLDLAAWDKILEANPHLAGVAPDVEALLIRRLNDRFECFLAPIDACYELVGIVRLNWKGFDGGEEVWREIDGFFARLRDRSRPAREEPAGG